MNKIPPELIYIANWKQIPCIKGKKLRTIERTFDESAIHYNKKPCPYIEKGEVVIIESVYHNFYGVYLNVIHNGITYNVDAKNLEEVTNE